MSLWNACCEAERDTLKVPDTDAGNVHLVSEDTLGINQRTSVDQDFSPPIQTSLVVEQQAAPEEAPTVNAEPVNAEPVQAEPVKAEPVKAEEVAETPDKAKAAEAEGQKIKKDKGAAPKKTSAKPKSAAAAAASQGDQVYFVLTVTIASARDLRAADLTSSDPFVRCLVNGDRKRSFCTPIINKNQNPVWNFSAHVSGLLGTDVLHFEVYDKDILSNDLLGRCQLTVKDVVKGFNEEIKLKDTGDKESYLKAGIQLKQSGLECSAPKVELVKLPLEQNGPKVMVTIMRAHKLRNADRVGKSDPYCVCKIPTKPDVIMRTPVVKESLDPTWDYTAQVANFEKDDVLNFSVFDDDVIGADLLGRAMLNYDAIMPKGGKYKLNLHDQSGKSTRSELEVEVSVQHK